MSLLSSNIVIYGSANMAESDSGTQGGTISTTTYVVFGNATVTNNIDDSLNLEGLAVGDAGKRVTVTGRSPAGLIVSEEFFLNGSIVDYGTVVFEKIYKITTSASTVNVVRIRKNSDNSIVMNVPATIRKVVRPFYGAVADKVGGSTRTYYEKVFVKNNNSTDYLLDARFTDGGGDTNGYITFATENTVDGTASVTNRLTAPDSSVLGTSGFSSSVKILNDEINVRDLASSTAIGIWLKLTLPAGSNAEEGTWTLNVSGIIK